jgi:hypothetical protein
MANKIQIKRSTANSTVTGLSAGELAFTANGNILYIGNPADGASVRIAGIQVPGTLTANQALVANATSGIDKVIVANLVPTAIYANNSFGSANQVLRTTGSSVYWADDTGDISEVVAGNGLTGGGTSGSVTLDIGQGNGISVSTDAIAVVANNGILANSSGIFAVSANGISVTSAGINVVGGDGLVANASGVHIGQGNGISVSADAIRVQQANGIAVDTGGVRVDASSTGGLVANATGLHVIASSGLVANATGLHVGTGNGISVSADAIAVSGGSTLTVNTAGVHVNTDLSITSLTTSGDVTVNGNTKLGDSTSDVVSVNARVNTAIVPSANITYDLGSNLLRWNNVYSSHIESSTAEVTGNLTVGGDLVVTGNVTTVNVSSLSVSDPLIKLAVNNTVSDTLYIGFTGHYNGAGNTTNHAGLFRSPVNKDFYLFSTYGDEVAVGNNTINVADPSFTLANLTSYLLSGGLVTNASHVAITANSTVNVSITANTLTLSSPLAGTSGGTGRATTTNNALLVGNSSNGYNLLTLGTDGYVLQSNGTALVYDVLDGGTF